MMENSLNALINNTKNLKKTINSNKSRQLKNQTIRKELRKLVYQYFHELRSIITAKETQTKPILSLDRDFQALLEMSHKSSLTSKYDNKLKSIIRSLIELEKEMVQAASRPRIFSKIDDDIDQQILNTLRKIVPSAAFSYEQAIVDLQMPKRSSWRGPATDLRESLREVLDHLAPDEVVTSKSNFKLEPNATGPTMKQKIRYILASRNKNKETSAPLEDVTQMVDEMMGKFVRSLYTRINISTHTPTDKSEVIKIWGWVRMAFKELLEIE